MSSETAAGGRLAAMVGRIRALMARHGFDVAGSRETVAAYLARHFPGAGPEVEALTAVLFLPRYLDCLKWLYYNPESRALASQYWAYFETCIENSSGDRQRQHAVNRLFLLELGNWHE